ncbi:MAG: low temperature requirement protein A [Nitratireductor sp.]|nr:low temperature requirement protein A [Nitratireductor sp.]
MDKSSILRKRGEGSGSKVGFVELFYDLVFVFSIIQLSHALAHHFTIAGVGETLILILAIWWLWMFTTWALNWLDPDTMAVRLLLFAMMFGGLVLASAIPEAWGEKGLLFGATFAAMQVGRSLFTAWIFWGNSNKHALNFLRIAIWLAFSGAFWIAGGLANHEGRTILWLIALLIEYASPALFFWVPVIGKSTIEDWDISGTHMAERCALFVIICIGETILVSGRSFAEAEMSAVNLVAFAGNFTGICMLWWIYFRFGHERAAHHIEHSNDPGRVGRAVFTYAHFPIVAGIILCAVGAEFVLAHPQGHSGWKEAAAVLGGPMIFLLGNIWFKGAVWGRVPLSHLLGLVLLALAVLVHHLFAPWQLSLVAAMVLIVVSVLEWRALKPAGNVVPQ